MTMLGAALLSVLPSCSCGIYRKYYTPSDRQLVLKEDSVVHVARMNGFGEGSPGSDGETYEKNDFLLGRSRDGKKLRLGSSFCPAPWNLHRLGKWDTECEATNQAVLASFRKLGIPLKEIPSEIDPPVVQKADH